MIGHRSPLREIVDNAGGEPSVVVNAVLAGKGNYGFNAANDTYGDMIEMGILDPTKVTRTALQNAASVASLMLTTEAMVAEAPKDESRRRRHARRHGRYGRHGHGHVSPGCIAEASKLRADFGSPFSLPVSRGFSSSSHSEARTVPIAFRASRPRRATRAPRRSTGVAPPAWRAPDCLAHECQMLEFQQVAVWWKPT